MVGRQALEIEFLKGALRSAPRLRSATTSVITGPMASPSPKDAVTFLFKAHPIHTNYAGPMRWPMEDTADILHWYRGFITKAPNVLNGFFAFLTAHC